MSDVPAWNSKLQSKWKCSLISSFIGVPKVSRWVLGMSGIQSSIWVSQMFHNVQRSWWCHCKVSILQSIFKRQREKSCRKKWKFWQKTMFDNIIFYLLSIKPTFQRLKYVHEILIFELSQIFINFGF